MSVLLLIEYSLEVASGKGFCKDLAKDYYRIGGSWECWEAAVGQGGVPQSCSAPSAFPTKENWNSEQMGPALGFPLGQGCVGLLEINVEPREVFISEDQPKLCSTL